MRCWSRVAGLRGRRRRCLAEHRQLTVWCLWCCGGFLLSGGRRWGCSYLLQDSSGRCTCSARIGHRSWTHVSPSNAGCSSKGAADVQPLKSVTGLLIAASPGFGRCGSEEGVLANRGLQFNLILGWQVFSGELPRSKHLQDHRTVHEPLKPFDPNGVPHFQHRRHGIFGDVLRCVVQRLRGRTHSPLEVVVVVIVLRSVFYGRDDSWPRRRSVDGRRCVSSLIYVARTGSCLHRPVTPVCLGKVHLSSLLEAKGLLAHTAVELLIADRGRGHLVAHRDNSTTSGAWHYVATSRTKRRTHQRRRKNFSADAH